MSTTPIQRGSKVEERPSLTFEPPKPAYTWLWWLPALLGGLYVIAILTHLRHILDSIWLSSDSDIDAVLAHLSMHAPSGSLLTTGDYPHYETLAFTLLTRSFPAYRAIWVLTPVIVAVVGLWAVVWSTMRSFGRWPASVVGAVLVCFAGGGTAMQTAGGLATVFAIDAHANSLVTAAICGAGLVWIIPRIEKLSVRRLAAVALGLGVLGGLPMAGDNLYLAWGLAPMLVVTVLAAWRGPQDGAARVFAFGFGTAVVSVLTALVFAGIMRSEGVRGFGPSYHEFLTFVKPGSLITNFDTLLGALPSLTAGGFFGKSVNARSELELLSAGLLFVALCAVVWSVRRRVANSLPRGAGGGDVVGARFVHTTFWMTALTLGLLVFMIGSPNPWTTDGRYLLGPYVAIAALLPLLLERGLGWKLIGTAGATLFALSALYQFQSGVVKEIPAGFPTAGTAHAVAAYAKKEDVSYSYGYYWSSINLMWNSDFGLKVYPVQRCLHDRQNLCTFREISISNWDKPHRGSMRTMLIVNPKDTQVRRRWKALGPPISSTRIGTLRLYVYGFDIASKLKPESGLTI
jgi:hypothetical protein